MSDLWTGSGLQNHTDNNNRTRTEVAHETFYLQFAPHCHTLMRQFLLRLLLIIHVSVICAAVHSHLEEEEGSSNPFLQVKRLIQIHMRL